MEIFTKKISLCLLNQIKLWKSLSKIQGILKICHIFNNSYIKKNLYSLIDFKIISTLVIVVSKSLNENYKKHIMLLIVSIFIYYSTSLSHTLDKIK